MNVLAIHPLAVKIFHSKETTEVLIWAPWLSVQSFVLIFEVDVEIFTRVNRIHSLGIMSVIVIHPIV